MYSGLFWCFAFLAGQLWVLEWVDRRLAPVPCRPDEPPPTDPPRGDAAPPA